MVMKAAVSVLFILPLSYCQLLILQLCKHVHLQDSLGRPKPSRVNRTVNLLLLVQAVQVSYLFFSFNRGYNEITNL